MRQWGRRRRASGARVGGRQAGPSADTGPGRAERIAEDCDRMGLRFVDTSAAILNCGGDETGAVPVRVLPVSGQPELTSLGCAFRTIPWIPRQRHRVGSDGPVFAVDASVVRRPPNRLPVRPHAGRPHRQRGRLRRVPDRSCQGRPAIRMLPRFCGGRIDVRTDGVTELRTLGLHDHPDGWLPFDKPSVYSTSRAGSVPSGHRDVLSTFAPPCLPMEAG